MTLVQVAEFSFEWIEIPTDYKSCFKCNEMIIGKMFIPIVTFGKIEDLDLDEIEIKLCKSCYEVTFP